MRQFRLPSYTYSIFLACALAGAPAASAAEAVFAVDTVGLLQTAIAAAVKKYPEISRDGLVAQHGSILINCSPEKRWLPVDPTTLECPVEPKEAPMCNAHVSFLIRSTIKRDVVALHDGMCRTNTEYEDVDVTVYGDGTTDVRRGSGSSGGTNQCSDTEPLYELHELVEQYQKISNAQFSP